MARPIFPGLCLALIQAALLVLAASASDDLCEDFGHAPIPFIKTDQFCATADLTGSGGLVKCDLLRKVQLKLASFTAANSTVCYAAAQTPAANASRTGRLLPFPLSDQRPLPTNLPASLLAAEGASYYWYWKILYNFELWAGCGATNATRTVTPGAVINTNASLNWLQPPGWRVHSTLWQRDGSAVSYYYWPFATIITDANSLVILIRGTETEADWLSDFDYSQLRVRFPMPFPGRVHKGFSKIAGSLWSNGIKDALDELVLRPRSSSIRNITVAGHSLGAAITTLISYSVQTYLNPRMRRPITVSALLFAPPTVGDATFAAAFGRTVNARRLPFLYDLVPQVPCTPTMASCPWTLVPTGNYGSIPYTTVPGTLLLQPSNMPVQPDIWSLFGSLYPCELPQYLVATHICSYNCYLSQFVNDRSNLCLLWNETSTSKQGTFCSRFPYAWEGLQYPFVSL